MLVARRSIGTILLREEVHEVVVKAGCLIYPSPKHQGRLESPRLTGISFADASRIDASPP